MASEETLRAYLVSIGFKINEDTYKKFKDRLEDTNKKVKELHESFKKFAEITIAAGGVLSASTLLIANKLEKLYFASQRTGASAANLRAFSQAAEQIGVSGEAASQSIENLASNLRMNPGLSAYLRQMGVDPSQDRTKVMLDLVEKLSTLPFPVGARIGQMFGIDPDTLFMFEKNLPELEKFVKHYQDLNKQTDEQAKKAHETAQSLREFENRLSTLKNLMAEAFLPTANKILDFLSKAVTWLIEADKATGGWSSRLLAVGSAILSVLGPLSAMKAALGFLGIGGAAEGTAAAAGTGALGTAAVGTAGVAAGVAGIGLEAFLGSPTLQKKLSDKVLSGKGNAFENWFYKLIYGSPADTTNAPRDAIMNRSNDFHNPGNLRSWFGTPSAERFRGKVSIGNFAKFGSDAEGLQAMASQLLLYSSRDKLNTLSGIISKYAPSSENDTGAYIADVAKRLGVTGGASLNLNDSGVLANLMQAMIHHEQGKDPFNLKTIQDAVNYRLGQVGGTGKTVTMNQKTEIKIASSDPIAAGQAVANEQRRVNGDMLRNMEATVK